MVWVTTEARGNGAKLPRVLGPNTGPLEEQVLLTPEPFLQAQTPVFY